jgi:hypothetical protein
LVAVVAYGIVSVIWRPDSRSGTGWFATLVMPPISLLAPSAVLVGVAVSVALLTRQDHLVVGAVTAAAAAVIAAIGVGILVVVEAGDAERYRLTDVFWSLTVAGVLGGLVATAAVLQVVSPPRVAAFRPARAAAFALPAAAAVAGLLLVDAAAHVTPSRIVDLEQVGRVHEEVTAAGSDARSQCLGARVSEAGREQAAAAVATLRKPHAIPSTVEVRRGHDERVAMWVRCAASIEEALRSERDVVTADDQRRFRAADAATSWLRQPTPCEHRVDLGSNESC